MGGAHAQPIDASVRRMARDAQPEPRPPFVTPRMIVGGLCVGFVLAVTSVPALALVAGFVPESWQRTAVNDALHVEGHGTGHIVFTQRTAAVVSTLWFTVSEPLGQSATTLRLAWMEEARDAEEDARPMRVRTALDGRHRSRSEWRVGWPWRAAYGQTDQLMGPDHAAESRGLWAGNLYGRALSVPYLPMWPGLLGNALVFGALVLVVRVCWRWRVVRTVLPE